jgi:hypothetical protein
VVVVGDQAGEVSAVAMPGPDSLVDGLTTSWLAARAVRDPAQTLPTVALTGRRQGSSGPG